MPSFIRLGKWSLAVLICAYSSIWISGSLHGQTMNLSLDLFYSDPNNTASAGTWQLVATSDNRGIAGAVATVADVNTSPTYLAPTGSGTGVPVAGFHQTFEGGTKPFWLDRGTHVEMLFGQIPVESPGTQGLFYDVGVVGGATQPGENGTPTITGFAAGTNVPWNFKDTLGDLLDDGTLNGSGALEGGVILASGSFNAATNPAFFTDPNDPNETSAGNVFLSLGDPNNPPAQGQIVAATISTQTRDNTTLPSTFIWNTFDVGNWNESNRWNPTSGPPGAGDSAVINSGDATPVTVSGSEAAASTTVGAGELLIDSGGILASPVTLVGGKLTGSGTIVGTFTNNWGLVAPGAGATSSAGAGAASVPEPASAIIAMLGAAALLLRRTGHIS